MKFFASNSPRTKGLFVLLICFLIAVSFKKSNIREASKIPDRSLQDNLDFNTDGLYYAEVYDFIFLGQFENLNFTREKMEFLMIFEQYLRAYGNQCDAFLPNEKVKIMEDVCAVEEVTKDGYGFEISRVCVEWKRVWTGLYADPDLYDAKMEVQKIQSGQVLQTTLEMVTDQNAINNSMNMVHNAKGLKNDMAMLFQLNGCNSPGLRQFEKNLRLFALNRPAERLEGRKSQYVAMKESGGPKGEQNWNGLADDLIADQSRTWAMNRYSKGNVSNSRVISRDHLGRPQEVYVEYSYQAFMGKSNGSVRIIFLNGLPECMYFFDFPDNCKSPGKSIIAAYAQGKYAN